MVLTISLLFLHCVTSDVEFISFNRKSLLPVSTGFAVEPLCVLHLWIEHKIAYNWRCVLTFGWSVFFSKSISLTGSFSGNPSGPSQFISSFSSAWSCRGKRDAANCVGSAQSVGSISRRSVSFSEASSCRSRRTLVSSFVRVSSRCLSRRTSSRERLRSARTCLNVHLASVETQIRRTKHACIQYFPLRNTTISNSFWTAF